MERVLLLALLLAGSLQAATVRVLNAKTEFCNDREFESVTTNPEVFSELSVETGYLGTEAASVSGAINCAGEARARVTGRGELGAITSFRLSGSGEGGVSSALQGFANAEAYGDVVLSGPAPTVSGTLRVRLDGTLIQAALLSGVGLAQVIYQLQVRVNFGVASVEGSLLDALSRQNRGDGGVSETPTRNDTGVLQGYNGGELIVDVPFTDVATGVPTRLTLRLETLANASYSRSFAEPFSADVTTGLAYYDTLTLADGAIFEFDQPGFSAHSTDYAIVDNQRFLDGDEDGMSDEFEMLNALNPADPGDALADADADGFSNSAEAQEGTDPFDVDSLPGTAGEATLLAASLLPVSRTVQVGTPATVFATMVNADPSTELVGCTIAPRNPLPSGFYFAATDSTSNAIAGARNVPVRIPPGGLQSFLLAFETTGAFASNDVELRFRCENSPPAAVLPEINTLLLSAATTPGPDVIALAASSTGVIALEAPANAGAFAVAAANVGAAGSVSVSADDGGAGLGLSLTLCETDPLTAACVNPAEPTGGPVIVALGAGATPTFSVFVSAGAPVPADPALNRVFVRFADELGGGVRGATSLAVQSVAME